MVNPCPTGLPLRREIVKPFAIGETEVTNVDYKDFLQATGHAAPAGWENGEFPPGTATLPVGGSNPAWKFCAVTSDGVPLAGSNSMLAVASCLAKPNINGLLLREATRDAT